MAAKRKSEEVTLPPGVQMSRQEKSTIEDRRQMLLDLVADFQRAGHSALTIGVVHGVALSSMRMPDNVTGLGMILAAVKSLMLVAEKHDDKFVVGVLRGIETTLAEAASFLEAQRGERSLQ